MVDVGGGDRRRRCSAASCPTSSSKKIRKKRLETIRKALPDSLDMLVICAEAGLASDAALKRVVAETSRKASALSEELNQTALELSFMPERRQALENLAERAPLPSVNAFVNTMIQAEKYGTPLARAFKVLSQEQRTERMLRAEEKAGRLPATMTVPMMIFILPALFIVLIGPAILDIMDNFIGMARSSRAPLLSTGLSPSWRRRLRGRLGEAAGGSGSRGAPRRGCGGLRAGSRRWRERPS